MVTIKMTMIVCSSNPVTFLHSASMMVNDVEDDGAKFHFRYGKLIYLIDSFHVQTVSIFVIFNDFYVFVISFSFFN